MKRIYKDKKYLCIMLAVLIICMTGVKYASAGVIRKISGFTVESGYEDRSYSGNLCYTYIGIEGPSGLAKLKVSLAQDDTGLTKAVYSSQPRQVYLSGSTNTSEGGNDLYDIRLESEGLVTTELTPDTKKYLLIGFDVSFVLPAHYIYDDETMDMNVYTNKDSIFTKDDYFYEADASQLYTHSDEDRRVTIHISLNLHNIGAQGIKINSKYSRVYGTGVTIPIDRVEHTLSFDKNADDASSTADPLSLKCGVPAGNLPGAESVSRQGYRFMGWFDKPNGGKQFKNEDSICEDTTVYAYWKENHGDFDLQKVYEDQDMFKGDTSLIGGKGAAYDENHVDSGYAHIDTNDAPGYFTEGKVE